MKWNESQISNLVVFRVITGYMVYFGFWWIYKLAAIPGLHGDEAWAGLKAIQFEEGHINQLAGMNSYTGILQPYFSSVAFSIMGKGIFQLRIIGALFNWAGIAILVYTFRSVNYGRAALIFLLIAGQSVFLIISPRVAWEVNSFTMFFISLLLLSICMMQVNNRLAMQKIGYSVFLVTNLIGTYNHVVFSCISIAGLVGLILWSIHNRSLEYKNLILLGLINALNLILLFCGMRFGLNKMTPIGVYLPVIILVLILSELYILNILTGLKVNRFGFGLSPIFTILLNFIFFNCFAYFHGVAFFQLVTNNKVILHFFSYVTTDFENALYIICGCVYLLFLIKFLIEDMLSSSQSAVYAWLIFAYLGLFSLYTINCSFRYYLSIFILSTMYMAIKFRRGSKGAGVCCAVMILTTISVNGNLRHLFTDDNGVLKPVYFNMGNGKMETSAHFLSNKPVIDFLKRNKIQQITYGSNQYFLEQPIVFMYTVNPWVRSSNKAAIIDYDFNNFGNGFQLTHN